MAATANTVPPQKSWQNLKTRKGSQLFTKQFIKEIMERAVKSVAGAAVSVIGTELVSLGQVNWGEVASISTVAAIVSILMSILSYRVGEPGASLVNPIKEKVLE
jgi:hypothetical protein